LPVLVGPSTATRELRGESSLGMVKARTWETV
jgi:hypothetical protein